MTTRNDGLTSKQSASDTDPQPGSAQSAESGVLRIEVEGRIVWQAIGAVLATLVLLCALNQTRGIVSMVAISFFFSLALDRRAGPFALPAKRLPHQGRLITPLSRTDARTPSGRVAA